MRLKWDPANTEPEVREIMRTLAGEYSLEEAGGLAERCRELARVIGEWLAGEIAAIPELEVDLDTRQGITHNYREVAMGGFFI